MKLRLLGGIFAALVIVVLFAGAAALVGLDRFERDGPLAEDVNLVVPRGANLSAISRLLEVSGVVEDARIFKWGVRLLGAAQNLKAGEFAFPAGVSMRGTLEILARGETVARWLTVAEGLTSTEAVALVAAAEGLSGGTGPVPPEGSLLPETYQFSYGDERAALIGRMQSDMQAALAELWPKRAEGLPIQTPEEAVILASIVEKETAVAAERPLVASVFVNRLNRGMRLQSDPTVVYGLTLGKAPLGRQLIFRDLDTPTPYNTYTNGGLPPGPIANPGRAALEAVLNPADTRYLYFVADGSGGHAFAKTLEEHNKNVAKWRKHQRRERRKQKQSAQ
jgi:UPF0755 protein